MRRLETAMDDLYSGLAEDLKPRSPGSTTMMLVLPSYQLNTPLNRVCHSPRAGHPKAATSRIAR